jgi:hypothetical protein
MYKNSRTGPIPIINSEASLISEDATILENIKGVITVVTEIETKPTNTNGSLLRINFRGLSVSTITINKNQHNTVYPQLSNKG